MLQFQNFNSMQPLSVDSLMEIYKNLTFPQITKIFKIFLLEDAQLPKKNPPYSSSMFTEMSKQLISIISCILGYQSDQWVDDAIVGFLSIFTTDEKPPIFNYNEIISESIHDQFLNLFIEGTFRYASVLVYLFLYHQPDSFSFSL